MHPQAECEHRNEALVVHVPFRREQPHGAQANNKRSTTTEPHDDIFKSQNQTSLFCSVLVGPIPEPGTRENIPAFQRRTQVGVVAVAVEEPVHGCARLRVRSSPFLHGSISCSSCAAVVAPQCTYPRGVRCVCVVSSHPRKRRRSH